MTLLRDQGPPEDAAMRPASATEEPSQRAVTLDGLAWTISLMDQTSEIETSIAETLRALAESGGSQAAARRLGLAEAATKAAQTAAEHGERLRRVVGQLAGHAEVAALRRSLDHADQLLADLARTENDIAGMLTGLADRGDPDRAARLRQPIQEALAAAQQAEDQARALRDLSASLSRNGPSPDGQGR